MTAAEAERVSTSSGGAETLGGALAAGGAGAWTSWTRAPGEADERDGVDLAVYERLLDAVRVEPPARG